jgi:hypothetical protein
MKTKQYHFVHLPRNIRMQVVLSIYREKQLLKLNTQLQAVSRLTSNSNTTKLPGTSSFSRLYLALHEIFFFK